MNYPTSDEFRNLLKPAALATLVDEYVFSGAPFGGVPFVFRNDPSAGDLLRDQLSAGLRVRPANVIVVGSAKIGFSLSPDGFPRIFSPPASDIDVLLVDEALFDGVWSSLLQWHYPRRWRLAGQEWEWAKARRDELYWGWFSPHYLQFSDFLTFPDALRPIRDLKANWLSSFRSLSRHPQLAKYEISGRLYRTWEHARSYHVDSLSKLLAVLTPAS